MKCRHLIPAMLALICCGATLSVQAAPIAPESQETASHAVSRLRALYEGEWKWRQAELGNVYHEGRWVPGGRLQSVTPESHVARADYWRKALVELDTIPLDLLPEEEKINAEVFKASTRKQLNSTIFRTYEAPFNSDSYFWAGLSPRLPYHTEAQYRDLLARMRDIPRYFEENIVNMRAGLARGWSVPRDAIAGRDETIVPYTRVDASNPFLIAFAQIPASFPEAVRTALQREAEEVVQERVVPAYARLLEFMREEYLPNTRTTTAAWDLPDGQAFYRTQIRDWTTLELDAEQIHEIGLKHVARINAEMREVIKRSGFSGSFEEFVHFLRTDPQFYARTPRELISYSAYVSKRVDAHLKHLFNVLPRYRFTILPVPDDIAPVYTSGRGGLDSCLMNTYDLPSRPLYNLTALTLHECAPGHSHQAAMALEGPNRPDFRRQTGFSGYGEGWGLYSEWLGTEMGLYETPYEDFGRLTFEMWRAARLVIDTGLHEFGWTRQQAIDYLAANTALSRHDIEIEVDRYITWPGQALAYYLGYLAIRELRAEAERELGGDFDVRDFHDVLLNLGSVPLPVLQQQIRKSTAEQKSGRVGK